MSIVRIKARKCFVPISPSRWVSKVFLTCDNMLAVQFRRGQHVKKILPHGPGAYLGHGGVPHVTCVYPGTQGELAETLYELAQVWSYGGEWVHAFLYKKFGYQLTAPPGFCGDCITSCTLSVSPTEPAEGQSVAISCTVTNADGSPTKGDAPTGSVRFFVDGVSIGTIELPDEPEPDSQNWATATIGWTATCQPQEAHTIEAQYAPADGDFAATSCSTAVTVSCGIECGACPPTVRIPKTLYATISNVRSFPGAGSGDTAGCADISGTYRMDYDAGQGLWVYTGSLVNLDLTCGSVDQILGWQFNMTCLMDGYIDGGSSGSPSSQSCDPLQLVFTDQQISVASACCLYGGTMDVTVTS